MHRLICVFTSHTGLIVGLVTAGSFDIPRKGKICVKYKIGKEGLTFILRR